MFLLVLFILSGGLQKSSSFLYHTKGWTLWPTYLTLAANIQAPPTPNTNSFQTWLDKEGHRFFDSSILQFFGSSIPQIFDSSIPRILRPFLPGPLSSLPSTFLGVHVWQSKWESQLRGAKAEAFPAPQKFNWRRGVTPGIPFTVPFSLGKTRQMELGNPPRPPPPEEGGDVEAAKALNIQVSHVLKTDLGG